MKDKEKADEEPEENEEEEDEVEQPFNFFNFQNFLQDPSKLFNSPQFKKMFQGIFKNLMNNLNMDNPPENFQNLSQEDLQKFMKKLSQSGMKGGPFMAGMNVDFDSEGNPVMNSFNSTKSKSKPEKKEEKEEVQEPLVDINEEEDEIIVIAELPGTEKENIKLNANAYTLTISTKEETNAGHKFYKEIRLPSAVNSDYARARYTNGILEVKLKKVKSDKQSNIEIE